MKKYIIYSLAMIVVANVIFFAWLMFFHDSVQGNFNCVSNHRMVHGDVTIQASYLFKFNNKNGLVKISGIVLQDNHPLSDIGRLVNFHYYSPLNSQFILISTGIQKLPLTNETESVLAEHLPSFFVEPGQKINLGIIRSDHQDYVITMAGVPVFYCDKI